MVALTTERLRDDHARLRERIHRLIYRASVAEDRAERLRAAIEYARRPDITDNQADLILRDALAADRRVLVEGS